MKITKAVTYFKQRPALIIVILTLLIINLLSIKPDFYFLGWDNYSSYFNLKTNIFRTFFATWRDYRSLGVPSDAEVTDIFRQIFFLAFKPLVGEKLVDQFYYLFALDTGILAMYFLASHFFHFYFQANASRKQDYPNHFPKRLTDFFSFLAAFFYLFNLNTYSIFSGPIIPYTNRFFSLPLVFLSAILLLQSEKISWTICLLIILAILFTTGSYITPTVFITVTISLGLFLIFQKRLKKNLLIFVFFILLNAFWLLPFLNYTRQKAAIMPLGSTFREINEVSLNKSKQTFSLEKQLLLVPMTAEMQYINKLTGTSQPFQPLAQAYQKMPDFIFLAIFPCLYLAGSGLILLSFKKNWQLLWIPTQILLFLFLSLKEYSPFGFIYTFLDKTIPFFGIVFRMGDAKFHSFISFAGSLSAAYFILFIFTSFPRWHKKITSHFGKAAFTMLVAGLATAATVPNLFIYENYFSGNLIGFFMYNQIPSAYFDIAKIINNDKGDFRVLHLPIEKDHYWRTFSWGYLGSAFFNFMIDKPLIDKTFEPGSLENSYLHQSLFEQQYFFPLVQNDQERLKRAQGFYQLLKKTNTKYVIFDKTESADIYPRGLLYMGGPLISHTQIMFDYLEQLGLVKKTNEYSVDLSNYSQAYTALPPLNGQSPPAPTADSQAIINLYKVQNFDQRITFSATGQLVDAGLNNLLVTNYNSADKLALQSLRGQGSIIYPFWRYDHQAQIKDNVVGLTTNTNLPINGKYIISKDLSNFSTFEQTHLIDVYASQKDNQLVLKFFERYLPTIQNNQFSQLIGEIPVGLTALNTFNDPLAKDTTALADWAGINSGLSKTIRLKIGDVTFPLPLPVDNQEKYLTSVIVTGTSFDFKILEKYDTKTVAPSEVFPYSPIQCYLNQLADYEGKVTSNSSGVKIQVKNGSACSVLSFSKLMDNQTSYLELNLTAQLQAADLDTNYSKEENLKFTSKPVLQKTIMSLVKPNTLRICLREASIDTCLNKHKLINISGQQNLLVPVEKTINNQSDLIAQIALVATDFQGLQATLSNINVNLFKPVLEKTLTLPGNVPTQTQVTLSSSNNLELSFPKSLSASGFFMNLKNESFQVPNGPCKNATGFRTLRTFNDSFISYVQNCDRALSQSIPVGSNNFLLWLTNYNLGSGQQPNLIVNNKMGTYFQERASLYQGYPFLPGFKLFQSPEIFTTQQVIKSQLNKLTFQTASVYLAPVPQPDGLKDFNFYQDSENEGLFFLKDFQVIEMPNSWQSLKIVPPTVSQPVYNLPKTTSSKQILPSLWQVSVKGPTLEQPGSDPNQKMLLKFNEGFDSQWQLYKGLGNLLIGRKAAINHYRCDGFANCFEVKNKDGSVILSGAKNLATEGSIPTYYLFYTPEKLAFLGWFITVATAIFFVKVFAPKPFKS